MNNSDNSQGASSSSLSQSKEGYINALREAKQQVRKLIEESEKKFDPVSFGQWFENMIVRNLDPYRLDFVRIRSGEDDKSYDVWKDCSNKSELMQVSQYYMDLYNNTHPGSTIVDYEATAKNCDDIIGDVINSVKAGTPLH